ncbi:MAG: hypothetical protein LBJ59_12375, partial [Zoogloeaceae bacterium]|nr:hypothetical protein [Zoogloeaceae bacterium]
MKRGFALPVFAALLTLAGCVSIHLYQKIAVVHEEYKARLASDPDLVIMREKCGISLEECPVDIFDNAYPTEDERAAIKKFGRLQEEYFDNYWSVQMDYANATNGNFAFLQRSKAQMNSLLQATVALHEGKFTWAQYGQTVAQINSDRMKEEYEKQEEARRHQEIIQTLEQENEPYPEFQRYRKESQHRHQETKHAPEPKSAPAPQPQKKA